MYSSLYIHVPFCRGKCAYCAFYSEPTATAEGKRAWFSGIERELAEYAEDCQPLQTIFIGGGTPSLLLPDEWQQLSNIIRRYCTLSPECEWSAEANPESLTPELLSVWRENGVNRVSLGVQSFHRELRKRIGRCGNLEHLPELVSEICGGSCPLRLNLDLMFALPGESLADWERDLQLALDCEPEHLSCYGLTLEEGTRLAKNCSPVSDEDFLAFWERTDELLNPHGIFRYEISNFAKTGGECRHNDAIWLGGTYLGLGPAASSFDGNTRRTNPASLSLWLAGEKPEWDPLPPDKRAAEILVTGLRRTAGWEYEEFRKRTGFDLLALRGTVCEKMERWGLLKKTEKRIAPTPKGMLFHDTLAEELL